MKTAMQEISNDGNIPYSGVWGNKWTYKKREVGYDGWQRFEREGASLAVLNERGEITKGGGAESSSVTLCLGSKKTQQLIVDYFGDIMNLGAVALQLDQPIRHPLAPHTWSVESRIALRSSAPLLFSRSLRPSRISPRLPGE